MDPKPNLDNIIESTSKLNIGNGLKSDFKIWKKPMEDKDGEFYIDEELITMYQNGLKNQWNPTQCVYEICSQCNWIRPQYIKVSYSIPAGFLFDVVVNKMLFQSKKPGKNIKIAKHLASTIFLQYLGFEYSFNDEQISPKILELPFKGPGLYSRSYLESIRKHGSNNVSKQSIEIDSKICEKRRIIKVWGTCKSGCCGFSSPSDERKILSYYNNRRAFSRETSPHGKRRRTHSNTRRSHSCDSSPSEKRRRMAYSTSTIRDIRRANSGDSSSRENRRRITYCTSNSRDIKREYSRGSSPWESRRKVKYSTSTGRDIKREYSRDTSPYENRRVTYSTNTDRDIRRQYSPCGARRTTNNTNTSRVYPEKCSTSINRETDTNTETTYYYKTRRPDSREPSHIAQKERLLYCQDNGLFARESSRNRENKFILTTFIPSSITVNSGESIPSVQTRGLTNHINTCTELRVYSSLIDPSNNRMKINCDCCECLRSNITTGSGRPT